MSFKFTHFKCPFKEEIKVGKLSLREREWIEVSLGDYKVDLAPLPGLHKETLEEALIDFKNLNSTLPSAVFAKEALELKVPKANNSLVNHLSFIDTNKLDSFYIEQWKNKKSIKLKIGRAELKEESSWLRQIMSKLDDKTFFRLDGNLNFSSDQLLKYLRVLDSTKIEYLEEPLENISDWRKVYEETNIPLALDENIKLRDRIPGVSHLVIKPTFNLSLKETLNELKLEKFKITISSAFDPPNNMAILHHLGNLAKGHNGLDTMKFLDLEKINSSAL